MAHLSDPDTIILTQKGSQVPQTASTSGLQGVRTKFQLLLLIYSN